MPNSNRWQAGHSPHADGWPWTETLGVSFVWSPAQEVGAGEGGSTELAVEPAAGAVEGDLRREASGGPAEGGGGQMTRAAWAAGQPAWRLAAMKPGSAT